MLWILVGGTFIFLLLASIQDMRNREVYDYISYSFIAFALITRLIWFSLEWDTDILIYTIPSFAILFGFSMLMYVAGQWGGGDAKLMAGLAIALGGADLYFLDFMMNLLVFGALYGVIYTLGIGIKNYGDVKDNVSVAFSILSISGVVAVYIMFFFPLGKILGFLVLLLLSIRYLHLIEKNCMYKDVVVEKLVEGDWLVQEIKGIEKKGTGLSKSQIEKIRSMGIRKVRVKEGIPFVPAFLITLAATQLLGNVLLSFASYQYLAGLLSTL